MRATGRMLTVLLALAALVSCARRSRDPVQAMLDDLVAAAESRDAAAFGERLSESFRGGAGQPKAVAVGEVRRWLAAPAGEERSA